MDATTFRNPAHHGFLRVAVAVPRNRVADPEFNADQTMALYRQAAAQGASLVVFPELGLSGYSCDDLFHQQALLRASEAALLRVAQATADLDAIALVGLPLRVDHGLFNCAVAIQRGRLLGIVPKTFPPNYGEFYELRQFSPAAQAHSTELLLGGQRVPFGTDLLFVASDQPLFQLHLEICEDLWVPIPPSSWAALAGATVLANLSASNVTIGKAGYRRALVTQQAARCQAAYLYSSAGVGESTTDLAWDGQSLIAECGELLRESPRFATDSHWISADVDLERIAHERLRQTTFGAQAGQLRETLQGFRRISLTLGPQSPAGPLQRRVERFPYVPAGHAQRDERCQEVYDIQVQGLTQRIAATQTAKLVIGISGGLDSTHALLVCARAMDLLGRPRSDILAYTMPGFATSGRTLDQAWRLMKALGCSAEQIDIRPSCEQMLRDIGHPYAQGEPRYDVAFENVQAGERTSHLFRLANQHGGLVVGTGDLSELALGWCTYGVGDHMSHYNVNASVPKTLIKHLVRWVADAGQIGEQGSQVLRDVLATEVSPELVPASPGQDGSSQPAQSTEATLGPYALHDFFLYYTLRHGFSPAKLAFLAWSAWHDAEAGEWPQGPDVQREQYTLAQIHRHLRTFLHRFFSISQFKRSCVPNAPKVGSGGSLSPRGDWRAPSDAKATAWLAALSELPQD